LNKRASNIFSDFFFILFSIVSINDAGLYCPAFKHLWRSQPFWLFEQQL